MSPVPAAGLPARVTVLSGGIGGARFLQGLLHRIETAGAATEVTVVANTADDIWLHGLKVCPDLDTVMYTLGGGIDAGPRVGTHRRDLAGARRSSRRTAWSRPGSGSATGTWPPTSCAPGCSTPATRCRR